MAMKLYTERYIQAIANAIRTKNGKTRTYKVREMAPAVIDLMSYVKHLAQMSSWFARSVVTGISTPDFSIYDLEAGYAVFDANGHYVVPAFLSKNPKLYLKIHATDGAWQIYPVLYTDANGMFPSQSNIGVYPMVRSNNVAYTPGENTTVSTGGFGPNTNLSTVFENSIFSKAPTYIWNVLTAGSHPAALAKLDDTNTGTIDFSEFSQEFKITDLVAVPERLNGHVVNAIVYRGNLIVNYPTTTNGTYFGVFFHTGDERVYYDTSEGKLKSAGTMKSYMAPASFGSLAITGICTYSHDNGVEMYFGKMDVSESDSTTMFDVTISQAAVADTIPFRTYDILDQNGNILAPKNCDLSDFGIEEETT